MHPAFSVIFLTVLLGFGQGIFLAMAAVEIAIFFGLLPALPGADFYVAGSLVAVIFLIGGLAASFAHLGRPERAWRAISQWRTSWLSREVIMVPAFIGAVAIYGLIHYVGWNPVLLERAGAEPFRLSLLVALGGIVLALTVFLCTGMVYACIKFLQEWASPLTVVNYFLLGTASGFVVAAAIAAYWAPALVGFLGIAAILFTAIAFVTRGASLIRNARLRPKSTPQSAIGVHHSRIVQKSQGAMGGSFNTREFFHHRSKAFMKSLRWIFLVAVFAIPLLLLIVGLIAGVGELLVAAAVIQFLGLIVERWFFLAEANHPQNIYYQSIA